MEKPIEAKAPGAVERLLRLLVPIMWRTSKIRVKDQLGLPKQTQKVHRLTFSKVEQHFYRTQHAECARAVLDGLKKAQRSDGAESVTHLSKCSALLLRLRQACCHPQVGAGGIRSTENRIMTMEEIHEKLVDDCKLKCEESQRLFIMNTAGVAALARIQSTLSSRQTNGARNSIAGLMTDRYLAEAARLYEEALLVAENNRTPMPVHGVTIMDGSSRSLVNHVDGAEVTLKWQNVDDKKGGDAPEVINLDTPLWARLQLTVPTKIMGLRLYTPTEEGALQCNECRLWASNSPDGQMMIEVATLRLQDLPSSDDKNERIVTGLNMLRSKMWKLEVLSFIRPAEGNGKKRPMVGGGNNGLPPTDFQLKVHLLTAEIDVDPIQVLHLSKNMADVLLEIEERSRKKSGDAESASKSADAGDNAVDGSKPDADGSARMSMVTEYKSVKQQPVAVRVQFLENKAAVVRVQYMEVHVKVLLSNQQHVRWQWDVCCGRHSLPFMPDAHIIVVCLTVVFGGVGFEGQVGAEQGIPRGEVGKSFGRSVLVGSFTEPGSQEW